jgi:SRSO17 transposase
MFWRYPATTWSRSTRARSRSAPTRSRPHYPPLPGSAALPELGSRGTRFYDWVWLHDVTTDADPDGGGGEHSLLIRRNTSTGELAFYRCWTPRPATLAHLVRVAGTRWTVEKAFQTAKSQVGLDEYETAWHHQQANPAEPDIVTPAPTGSR